VKNANRKRWEIFRDLFVSVGRYDREKVREGEILRWKFPRIC
jgi:hypothetical protein